jgi:hypothetical protein
MKGLFLLFVGCFSLSIQAGYRIHSPLEISNNGGLPDGSILFVGGNGGTTPTNPETPEEGGESNCLYDIGTGTAYVEIAGNGEVAVAKLYNGQRISNGVKGSSMMTQMNASYYELCLNGQAPIPYVPASDWANSECKYNSGLGFDSPRHWSDTYDINDNSIKLFSGISLGEYENNGSISQGTPGAVFPNDWVLLPSYELKMTSNGRIVYNGYQYFRGALKNSIDGPVDQNGQSKPTYYYEVCRTKI